MNVTEWLINLSVSEISFVNTYYAEASDYPMKNHGRRHHGFLYTIEGTETYNFKDKIISTTADTLLYIPANEKYTIDFEGERSVVIAIDFETAGAVSPEPFCIKMKKNNEVKPLFGESERIWLRKRADHSAMCKSHFYRILALVINHEINYSNSDSYNKIADAVDYLHKSCFESNFRISELFEIAGISPRYFETLFYKEFKATPKEYITSLKLAQAKELLKSEKYSVSEVALQLGFGDIYHFSKVFKAKTGKTPTGFIKDD